MLVIKDLYSDISDCFWLFYGSKYIIGSRHFSHNKRDMNPFEFWYATNPGIRNFVNTYYEEHIHLLDGYKKLQADSMMLFNQGSVIEKLQVLTILAARKIYA